MKEKPVKCIRCGKMPTIIDMKDICYAQCPCGKWNLYEFCAVRPDLAIKEWNKANSDGKHWSGVEV